MISALRDLLLCFCWRICFYRSPKIVITINLFNNCFPKHTFTEIFSIQSSPYLLKLFRQVLVRSTWSLKHFSPLPSGYIVPKIKYFQVCWNSETLLTIFFSLPNLWVVFLPTDRQITVVRQKNTVISPAGHGIKNICASEDHPQSIQDDQTHGGVVA